MLWLSSSVGPLFLRLDTEDTERGNGGRTCVSLFPVRRHPTISSHKSRKTPLPSAKEQNPLKRIIVLLVAALATSAWAQTPATFDLVCNMARTTWTGQRRTDTSTFDYTVRISVDLTKRLWISRWGISGVDDKPKPIPEVTDAEIVLGRFPEDGFSDTVNRYTGVRHITGAPFGPLGLHFDDRGPCERAPFTPFPRKF